jgi:hypothetical protein
MLGVVEVLASVVLAMVTVVAVEEAVASVLVAELEATS